MNLNFLTKPINLK